MGGHFFLGGERGAPLVCAKDRGGILKKILTTGWGFSKISTTGDTGKLHTHTLHNCTLQISFGGAQSRVGGGGAARLYKLSITPIHWKSHLVGHGARWGRGHGLSPQPPPMATGMHLYITPLLCQLDLCSNTKAVSKLSGVL